MPLALLLPDNRGLDRLLRLRRRPGLSTLFAAGLLLGAWGLRAAIDPYVVGVPFITFYPALILAALLGFGPAMFVLVTATLISWYFYVPPYYSFAIEWKDSIPLQLFVVFAVIVAFAVRILNWALERYAAEDTTIRLLFENVPNGLVVTDTQGAMLAVNETMAGWLGVPRDQLLGKPFATILPDFPEGAGFEEAARALSVSQPGSRESALHRKDGVVMCVDVLARTVPQRRRTLYLWTLVDRTEKHQAEARERLIARELHHRAANLLTLVNSIAHRTLLDNGVPVEARRALTGRIVALSKSFASLTQGTLENSLHQIIAQQLLGYENRLEVNGPDFSLNPEAAQSFALIFHELTTNATKYGALSSGNGRISVTVRPPTEQDVFELVWTETGGPETGLPTRQGFGTTLLRKAAQIMDAELVQDFRRDGLEVRIAAKRVPSHREQEAV
jgi:PAS domain S-box-containing protein